MRLIALIDQPPVIQRILSYLGLPTDIPEPRPARDPPRDESHAAAHSSDGVPTYEFGA